MKCKIHPKYNGKKKPHYGKAWRFGCTCFDIWLKLQTPRMGVQPTKVIPDKTKYNRKKQDKPSEES
jgi:hypothetical protein